MHTGIVCCRFICAKLFIISNKNMECSYDIFVSLLAYKLYRIIGSMFLLGDL